MKLKIERVKKKDRETVARFIAEIWGRSGDPAALAEAAVRHQLLHAADYDAFLFERGGVAVAYALLRENGDHVFLRHFIVTAAERRKGLGRACFRLLEEEFGHPEFRLDVTEGEADAQAFWTAMGFAPAAVMMRRPSAEGAS